MTSGICPPASWPAPVPNRSPTAGSSRVWRPAGEPRPCCGWPTPSRPMRRSRSGSWHPRGRCSRSLCATCRSGRGTPWRSTSTSSSPSGRTWRRWCRWRAGASRSRATNWCARPSAGSMASHRSPRRPRRPRAGPCRGSSMGTILPAGCGSTTPASARRWSSSPTTRPMAASSPRASPRSSSIRVSSVGSTCGEPCRKGATSPPSAPDRTERRWSCPPRTSSAAPMPPAVGSRSSWGSRRRMCPGP